MPTPAHIVAALLESADPKDWAVLKYAPPNNQHQKGFWYLERNGGGWYEMGHGPYAAYRIVQQVPEGWYSREWCVYNAKAHGLTVMEYRNGWHRL